MTTLGPIALGLSAVLAAWGLFTGIAGWRTGAADLSESARRAVMAVAAVLSVAVLSMLAALVRLDLNVHYVAGTTNRALPVVYRVAAVGAAPAGALLVAAFLAAALGSALVGRRAHASVSASGVVAASVLSVVFALTVAVMLEAPLARLPYTPLDGQGLPQGVRTPVFLAFAALPLAGAGCAAASWALAVSSGLVRGRDEAAAADMERAGERWARWVWLVLALGVALGATWSVRAGGRVPLGGVAVAWLAAGVSVAASLRGWVGRHAVEGLPLAAVLALVFAVPHRGPTGHWVVSSGAARATLFAAAALAALLPLALTARHRDAARRPRPTGSRATRWAVRTSLVGLGLAALGTMAMGTGAARTVTLGVGDTVTIRGWATSLELRHLDVSGYREFDRAVEAASAAVHVGGVAAGTMTAERRQHFDVFGRPLRAPVGTAGVRRTLVEDYSVSLLGVDGRRARYAITVMPLGWLRRGGMALVLVGAAVLALANGRLEGW